MPPLNPALPIFAGGQMTDLPEYSGVLFLGDELMEIVSPGNEEAGVNYSITTALLASLLIGLSSSQVVIGNGEHIAPGDPYIPDPTVARIYVNKTVAEPTYIQMGLAAAQLTDALIADTGGAVTDTNYIHVLFTGGELADGLAEVPITTPYGGYFVRPVVSLNKWHLGTG